MEGSSVSLTDEQIQQEVLDELKWDARVRPNEVGVSSSDGVVALTGWVENYAKKYAAEDAALRVRGVRALANDIEVRIHSSAVRSDAEIVTAVTRALECDAELSIPSIDVTVGKGWVSLTGVAESQFQKNDAERLVRRLSGVRGVTNLIFIRPLAKALPEQIKDGIEEALVRSARTDSDQIAVDLQDNRVILTGTVRSPAERQEAEEIAWSAPGVFEVENWITVRPPLTIPFHASSPKGAA